MNSSSLDFEQEMKRSVYQKESGVCIVCHRKCDPFFCNILEENPNSFLKNSKLGPFIAHPECVGKASIISRFRIHYIFYFSGILLMCYSIFLTVISGDIYSVGGLILFAALLIGIGKQLYKSQKRKENDFIEDLKRKRLLRKRLGKEFI
jgi:hypothetical protein